MQRNAAHASRQPARAASPALSNRRAAARAATRLVVAEPVAAATPAPVLAPASAAAAPEPRHAGAEWREHDLMIRRFQLAGLTPTEIAVVLHSKGLRVRMWHVSETFVRNRLKALGFTPNASRDWYAQSTNCYRRRIPASS